MAEKTTEEKPTKRKKTGRPSKLEINENIMLNIENEVNRLKKSPEKVEEALAEIRLLMLVFYKRLLASGGVSSASTLDSIRKFLVDNSFTSENLARKKDEQKRAEDTEAWVYDVGELPFPFKEN